MTKKGGFGGVSRHYVAVCYLWNKRRLQMIRSSVDSNLGIYFLAN